MPRKVYVNGKQKNENVVDLDAHVGEINKMMEASRDRIRRGKSANIPEEHRGKLKRK